MSTQLAAAQLSDGRAQIWASNGRGVFTLWKTSPASDSSWTPWQPFPVISNIQSTAVYDNGAVALFGLAGQPGPPGPFAVTYHKVSGDADAAWSDSRVVIGDVNCLDVAANTLEDGRMQVFAPAYRGFGGEVRLLTAWQNSADPDSGFSPVTDMTGADLPSPAALTAVKLSDGRLQLIGGTHARPGLLTTFKEDNDPDAAWTPWSEFPSVPQTDDVIALTWAPLPDMRTQVFSVNRVGELYTTWKASPDADSDWISWQPFTAPDNLTTVAAALLSSGQIQLFIADQAETIFTAWKATADPDAAWTPWQPFPGP